MLSQIELLSLRADQVGRALTAILVKRALVEVLVRGGVAANTLLANARYQLSLRCGQGNPQPALLLANSTADLKQTVASLQTLVDSLAAAGDELDEFTVVMEAPQAIAGLVVLLEDNRRRVDEVRALLKNWQKAVEPAAHS